MLVKDYMTSQLVTVTPDTTVMKALDLMKAHEIHRLPVVEGDQMVGLLTEELVARNSPSMATSLSMHELNYLLNKTTAKDIMLKQVITVKPDTLLEEAASVMRQNNIGVLPVVEARGHLAGIITDKDIFDAFIDISGYNTPGSRIVIQLDQDKKGMLEDISSTFVDHDVNITQITVYHDGPKVEVVVHVDNDHADDMADLVAQAGYRVISAIKK